MNSINAYRYGCFQKHTHETQWDFILQHMKYANSFLKIKELTLVCTQLCACPNSVPNNKLHKMLMNGKKHIILRLVILKKVWCMPLQGGGRVTKITAKQNIKTKL